MTTLKFAEHRQITRSPWGVLGPIRLYRTLPGFTQIFPVVRKDDWLKCQLGMLPLTSPSPRSRVEPVPLHHLRSSAAPGMKYARLRWKEQRIPFTEVPGPLHVKSLSPNSATIYFS